MDLIPMTQNGEYMEVNPVAVDEHIALGWRACEKQEDASPRRLSIADVREALTAKGIAFDVSLRKVDLLALLGPAEMPVVSDFAEGASA